MTIHNLFTEAEQVIISEALEIYRKKCQTHATAPIKGHGRVSELTKKEDWKNKQTDIEELQSKIVELTF